VVQTNKADAQATRSPAPGARPTSAPGFEDFFQLWFRELVRTAMYAGATKAEAEDAAAKTLTEMWPNWEKIQHPRTYARRAVVNNFIKDKTRGPGWVARRLVERGEIPAKEGIQDSQLTAWEDEEWVRQQLHTLPPAQREVMECIVSGLRPAEIAAALGKTPAAIRRNLCDALKQLRHALQQEREPERPPHRVPSSPREEAR
jgi:RNA polymerase sigma factor (sigma-70 family)